jgi:hypothetical protein
MCERVTLVIHDWGSALGFDWANPPPRGREGHCVPPGEYVYRVPSLEVPCEGTDDREALLQTAAVSLFVARVRAVSVTCSLPVICEAPPGGC